MLSALLDITQAKLRGKEFQLKMKKCLVLIAVALLVAAVPAMAARVTSVPITHEVAQVYQAYDGDSNRSDREFLGYNGVGADVITAVPGVLSIVPGTNWSNFVGAAVDKVPYTIKNVILVKQTPQIIQCADVFPVKTVPQQGTPNIRLWWPLMYEVPSTTWTLTILYGTPVAYDDDGAGPNPATYAHTEVWQWHVDATLESLEALINLFHELPFGKDEVPLISDECLYPVLLTLVDEIELLVPGNLPAASLVLTELEMTVVDRCISESPEFPNPTGPGTGIAQTDENPACCKLLADFEYIGFKYNILQPAK